MHKIFNALALMVLVTMVIVQWVGFSEYSGPSVGVDLSHILPQSDGEWRSQDVPLGATEAVEQAVEKALRFDSFVHRIYRHGDLSFTVYAAYWGRGKMPVHLVASHTPDRCWTQIGWKCSEMRFKQTYSVNGVLLKPAEFRIFESSQQKQYVVYWHLIGDRVYDYGERLNSYPHLGRWLFSALESMATGIADQYFIRVNSTAPFEVLLREPFFIEVLQSLAALGLGGEEMSGWGEPFPIQPMSTAF